MRVRPRWAVVLELATLPGMADTAVRSPMARAATRRGATRRLPLIEALPGVATAVAEGGRVYVARLDRRGWIVVPTRRPDQVATADSSGYRWPHVPRQECAGEFLEAP